jgi:putative protease
MCVSYSGRCLLSNYFAGRDANGGACAQPCRWKYYVHEEKRPEDVISAEQDEYGTYLFSSKDLCMVEHIGALAEAGLDSLKIEGRVKSAYYTAAVTNAYRMALDDYYAGKPFNPAYRAEVESVSHREYATGYFYGNPHENANIVGNNIYLKDRAFLAVVKDYDEKTGLALCEQFNKMQVGDKANLLSPGTTGRDITVEALFDKNGQPISDTKHPRMEFYLKIENAKAGDLIRGI